MSFFNGFNGLSLSLKYNFLQRKLFKKNQQTGSKKTKKQKTQNTTKQSKRRKKKRKHTLQNIYHNGPMEFQSYLFHFIWTLFLSFYGTGYSV